MDQMKQDKRGKALPVDWESVTAFWLQTGRDYKATSEAYGIKRNTLVKRFSRLSDKGKPLTASSALKKVERAKMELVEIAKEDGRNVTVSPIDAFQNQKDGFKANMSQAMAKAGEYVATLPPDAILSESRKVKDIMDTAGRLYGFGEDGSKAGLSVNILNLTADSLHNIR